MTHNVVDFNDALCVNDASCAIGGHMNRNDPQLRVRLPKDAKDWVQEQARKNLRTQSAEIELAIRDRMAATGDIVQDQAPVAVPTNALQGVNQLTNA